MKIRALIASAALVLALPHLAQAQSQQATATVTIDSNLYLDVTNRDIDFGTQTEPGTYAGDVTSVIDHRGNVTHSVYIAADQTHFDPQDDPGANATVVPASRMEWSLDGSSWTPLSTSTTPVISGAPPGDYPGAATVQYRIEIEMTDSPDTYVLPFTYSILADG